jgi:hypothetical protein
MGLDNIEDENLRKQKSTETMQKLNDLSVSLVSETILLDKFDSSSLIEMDFLLFWEAINVSDSLVAIL